MEDQALDLARMAGAAVGTLLTTWLALVRPLDKRLRRSMVAPEDIASLGSQIEGAKAELREISTRLARLEERGKESREKLNEACQDVKSVQEKLGRTVTDDEFAAYVQSTNSEVRSLSERLGRAAGAIEAWSHQQSSGR